MRKLLIVALITIPFLYQCDNSDEDVQWRGPERTGFYPEQDLLKEWPEDGPELLWKYEDLGLGYSSVAILNDQIITLGVIDSTGYIFALDLEGNILWKEAYGREWTGTYPGSRVTPLLEKTRGYFLSSLGNLICFSTEDGSKIWEINVFDLQEEKINQFGITENLVMKDDVIYCAPGGSEVNVIAVNKYSGEIIWKSKAKGEKNAYCSPILIERGGKTIYITNTASSVIAIDTENGELLWSHELFNKQHAHANTPIYKNGYLFVMDGFEAGSIMLRVSEDGQSVEQVWKNELLDETNGHSVLMNGELYMSAESEKKFCCVDWETGEIKYFIKRFSPGTVIAADGMLYCYDYFGDVGLLEPTGSEFIVKGSFRLPKKRELHISHPVIRDGKLYIRYANILRVYNIAVA